jgi:hypothetical protein
MIAEFDCSFCGCRRGEEHRSLCNGKRVQVCPLCSEEVYAAPDPRDPDGYFCSRVECPWLKK